MTKVCKNCGKEYNAKANRQVNCSKKCMSDGMRGNKNVSKRPEIREKYSIAKKENPIRYWLGKKRHPETIVKMSENRVGKCVGKEHPKWKGNEVGYIQLHAWVRQYRGKPEECEQCGGSKNMNWANRSHEYKRDLDDWIALCRKCHIAYDKENGAWGVATAKYKLPGRTHG